MLYPIRFLLHSYLKVWGVDAKSFFDIRITHFIIFANSAANRDIMDCEEIKKQRGGRREGAGRPKGDSKLYSLLHRCLC